MPSKTLSNVFYAVKLVGNEEIELYKALCCWLNSTFGLLLILSNRSETRNAWIRLKLSHWRLQHVLDISKLGKEVIKSMSKIFDKYGNKVMFRLPHQYDPEKIDPNRIALDKEILQLLGVNVTDNLLRELYRNVYDNFTQWFVVDENTKI